MNPIGSIQSTQSVLGVSVSAARRPDESAGPSFQDYFAQSLRRLQEADASAQPAATAVPENLRTEHRSEAKLLAEAEHAALTLRLVEQVGNRVAATIDELKQIRV